MKRVLFASVAAAALMFGSLMASAQDTYGTGAMSPAQTGQSTMPSTTTTTDATNDMNTMAEPAAPAQGANYGATTTTDVPASNAPNATASGAQNYDGAQGSSVAGASTDPNAATAQTALATGDTMQSAQTPSAPYAAGQSYAQLASAPSQIQTELAQEAGLAGVPMTAQEVCAQRTVTLAGEAGSERMDKVENAVDRASVCQMQTVVINAPAREAARLKRAMVERGVAEDMITTQAAAASEANVQMNFAGIATSSPQFSSLFNGTSMASADPAPHSDPSMQPSSSQSMQSSEPTGYTPTSAPQSTPSDMSTPSQSY